MTSSRPSRSICARTKPQRPKSMRQPRRCSRKHRRRHRLRLPRPAPRPALTLYIRIGQLIKGGRGRAFSGLLSGTLAFTGEENRTGEQRLATRL
jgi:hypothetical protein